MPMPPTARPPFERQDIIKLMKWRDGDIVVCSPPKSGTTWALNIAYQLREGGTDDFDCLHKKNVPWPEFGIPQQTDEELVAALDNAPSEPRRICKTHLYPPILPYFEHSSSPDMKYVVVLRNPEEAAVSFRYFFNRVNPDFMAKFGMPRVVFPDFETFYRGFYKPMGYYRMTFDFVAEWWPLRHNPNVLMIHYSDMIKDHEGSIRKIADFLGFELTKDEWPVVLEHTSFKWMKENATKFDGNSLLDLPIMEPKTLVRKGSMGTQREDGMTDEIAEEMKVKAMEILKDEDIVKFLYEGGQLP